MKCWQMSPFQSRLPKERRFLPLYEHLAQRGQVGETASRVRQRKMMRDLVKSGFMSPAHARKALGLPPLGGVH